jgi:hypothetical protein
MIRCQRCGSDRIMSASAKCSDLGRVSLKNTSPPIKRQGYIPGDLNIGGGDYLKIDVCLDCGQFQGKWPITDALAISRIKGEP